MTISRRKFLSGSAVLGGAAALGVPHLGHAQDDPVETSLRKVVIIYAQGGWDVTYALDPKMDEFHPDDPEKNILNRPGGTVETRGQPEAPFTWFNPTDVPKVDEFFDAHWSKCAIVRGITVRSVAHESCAKRFLTGTPSASSPDFAAIVANEAKDQGISRPVPYMVLGTKAFSGNYAAITGRLGRSQQLLRLIKRDYAYERGTDFTNLAPAYPRPPTIPEDVEGEPPKNQASLINAWLAARAGAMKGTPRGTPANSKKKLTDFIDSLGYGDQLVKDLNPIVDQMTIDALARKGLKTNLASQMGLCHDILSLELSWCVTMDTGTPWDSHDDNDTTQKRSHEELYTALNDHIGALIEDENTLVVVLSEMSRTPVVNGDDGKDHWPVTSALLFGAGIKPGIYGATTTGLEADKPAPLTGLPVDPLTGRVDEDNGLKIETEHFVAGILYAAGLGVDKINGVDGYLPGVDIYRAFKDETS